jgi:hypothetical protein
VLFEFGGEIVGMAPRPEPERRAPQERQHGSASFPIVRRWERIDRLAENVNSHRLSMGIAPALTDRGRGA